MSDTAGEGGHATARAVFIIGAPRSGTTYVQNLLGSHPLIVTSQETDLFVHYVVPWRERWESQLPVDRDAWARARHKGLPAVVTETEFDSLVESVVQRIYAAILALKPSAEVVLDKTPHNGRYGAAIVRYLPDARFIHVIRDGRDVVSSQLRASRGWGRDWAPGSAAIAADRWRDDVETCRSVATITDAYLELRYEELLSAQGPALVSEALRFCGVQASTAETSRIHAAHDQNAPGEAGSSLVWGGEVARRLGGTAPAEPAGFSGSGGVGSWQRELDARARIAVEDQAGELLRSLGYAGSADWVGAAPIHRRAAVATLALDSVLRRARNRLSRTLQC